MSGAAELGRDLAIVGQDPRFGGGFRSIATAFWEAATALGRTPHLFFLSREHAVRLLPPQVSRLTPRRELFHEPFDTTALPSTLPELDALNQVIGGFRLARRARRARTVVVVATTAPYGFGAAISGKPYIAWLATGLESEWAARRAGLRLSRRIALVLNRPVLRALERFVIRRARAVYAISPASRLTVAEGGGVPPDRVGILPIPVDAERFTPAPEDEWRARLDRPVLVFVGRANDPRKNVRLLVDAFREVRVRYPEAVLRIGGVLPSPDIVRPGEPGVELLGPMTDDELPLHLSSASLFVLPSFQEGFGIVVAEALASGLPVVSTPSGGPEELLRESGGGVVLGGFGREELASTLLDLIADPDRLAGMRRAGHEYVSRVHARERFRDLVQAAIEELARA